MTPSKKAHMFLRMSGIAVASLVLSGGSTTGLKVTAERSAAVPCTLECSTDCPLTGFHKALAAGQLNGGDNPNGTHDECFELTCNSTHPCSSGFLVDQTELAIDRGNGEALRHLLAANPAILINRSRSAVQVRNCGGDIVASLPASAELLDRLGASER